MADNPSIMHVVFWKKTLYDVKHLQGFHTGQHHLPRGDSPKAQQFLETVGREEMELASSQTFNHLRNCGIPLKEIGVESGQHIRFTHSKFHWSFFWELNPHKPRHSWIVEHIQLDEEMADPISSLLQNTLQGSFRTFQKLQRLDHLIEKLEAHFPREQVTYGVTTQIIHIPLNQRLVCLINPSRIQINVQGTQDQLDHGKGVGLEEMLAAWKHLCL